MQKFILQLLILSLLPISASAQRLIYNEKAPKIEAEVIIGEKINKDLPIYMDFFVMNSPQNESQLEVLEKVAKIYNKQINFVVISKDDASEIINYFKDKNPSYKVMIDINGETFKNYNIKFVPFSVMINKKGDFIWHGKNSSLNESIINQVIK